MFMKYQKKTEKERETPDKKKPYKEGNKIITHTRKQLHGLVVST